eukprot:1147844-Pelagomonas_calceolata.AAC.12
MTPPTTNRWYGEELELKPLLDGDRGHVAAAWMSQAGSSRRKAEGGLCLALSAPCLPLSPFYYSREFMDGNFH